MIGFGLPNLLRGMWRESLHCNAHIKATTRQHQNVVFNFQSFRFFRSLLSNASQTASTLFPCCQRFFFLSLLFNDHWKTNNGSAQRSHFYVWWSLNFRLVSPQVHSMLALINDHVMTRKKYTMAARKADKNFFHRRVIAQLKRQRTIECTEAAEIHRQRNLREENSQVRVVIELALSVLVSCVFLHNLLFRNEWRVVTRCDDFIQQKRLAMSKRSLHDNHTQVSDTSCTTLFPSLECHTNCCWKRRNFAY